MKHLSNILVKELHTLFAPDDPALAYFALTGKIELQVRDKLAYRLHTYFAGSTDFAVFREWERRDLAIFNGSKLRLLLEAKAAFTFDFVRPIGKTNDFAEIIQDDLRKAFATAKRKAQPEVEVLSLLLVSNPLAVAPTRLQTQLKYLSRKKAQKELRTFSELDTAVCERVPNIQQITSGRWTGGTEFDTPIEVGYWLFRQQQNEA